MDAFEILVIILSVFLAIFLLLGIITLVYLVKFIKNIKEISDKAKTMVEDASSFASTMKKTAAPAAMARFVAEQVNNAKKKHKEDK